ncbi:hypothetical protein QYM36_006175 [Artemia franciscana]|uniref:Uncharacterized protein n=1 Tax=Artemia franciscana TaxID=6661 RepID=A0AA88HWU7_ARTSF|nr:hypothetical protein QYM36_006175 [Artemia franciscana]
MFSKHHAVPRVVLARDNRLIDIVEPETFMSEIYDSLMLMKNELLQAQLITLVKDAVESRRVPDLETSGYNEISDMLKNSWTEPHMLLVVSIAKVFRNFTGAFQTENPLNHAKFNKIRHLVLVLMSRYVKPEVSAKMKRKNAIDRSNIDQRNSAWLLKASKLMQ